MPDARIERHERHRHCLVVTLLDRFLHAVAWGFDGGGSGFKFGYGLSLIRGRDLEEITFGRYHPRASFLGDVLVRELGTALVQKVVPRRRLWPQVNVSRLLVHIFLVLVA